MARYKTPHEQFADGILKTADIIANEVAAKAQHDNDAALLSLVQRLYPEALDEDFVLPADDRGEWLYAKWYGVRDNLFHRTDWEYKGNEQGSERRAPTLEDLQGWTAAMGSRFVDLLSDAYELGMHIINNHPVVAEKYDLTEQSIGTPISYTADPARTVDGRSAPIVWDAGQEYPGPIVDEPAEDPGSTPAP